jgi:hypothetical protein
MSEIDAVCAEVRVSGTYIRMFSEYAAGGVKISVFDVDSREWVARFVTANSIEEGKEKAEELTKTYLDSVYHSELPIVPWMKSDSPSWVALSNPIK